MSDAPTERDGRPEGSRMMIEPDAIHEGEDGIYLDCPQCGASVSFEQIVTEGRCDGYLKDELTESANDKPVGSGCDAKLALELVWES